MLKQISNSFKLISGISSTKNKVTYPTIQVIGATGPALVIVSCVTKDPPYRSHPHSIVGKEKCLGGVCTMEITSPDMICSFQHLGIQCAKIRDIEKALLYRKNLNIDPFGLGFDHAKNPREFDLGAVRLCFQVFLKKDNKYKIMLEPVISIPILNKACYGDLRITKLSHCSSPVSGGKEIILLCEKVFKDDIQVKFFQQQNDQLLWEADAQILDLHKNYAIVFRTPAFQNLNIQENVRVLIQLVRPSKQTVSNPVPFEYIPSGATNELDLRRKRQKINQHDTKIFAQIMAQVPNSHPSQYQVYEHQPPILHQFNPYVQPTQSQWNGFDNVQFCNVIDQHSYTGNNLTPVQQVEEFDIKDLVHYIDPQASTSALNM